MIDSSDRRMEKAMNQQENSSPIKIDEPVLRSNDVIAHWAEAWVKQLSQLADTSAADASSRPPVVE